MKELIKGDYFNYKLIKIHNKDYILAEGRYYKDLYDFKGTILLEQIDNYREIPFNDYVEVINTFGEITIYNSNMEVVMENAEYITTEHQTIAIYKEGFLIFYNKELQEIKRLECDNVFITGEYLVVYNNNNISLTDKQGNPITKYSYNDFYLFNKGIAVYDYDFKGEFFTKRGEKAFDFDNVVSFITNGQEYLIDKKDDGYYYIYNTKGEVVYKSNKYIPVDIFKDKYIIVTNGNNRFIIDFKENILYKTTGIIKISHTNSHIEIFEDYNRVTLLDENLNKLIEFDGDIDRYCRDYVLFKTSDDTYTVYDLNKKSYTMTIHAKCISIVNEGIIRYTYKNRCVYIDLSRNIYIEGDYEDIEELNYGIFIVQKNNKIGIIDKENNELLPAEYQACIILDEDRILLLIEEQEKFIELSQEGYIIEFNSERPAGEKDGKEYFIKNNTLYTE